MSVELIKRALASQAELHVGRSLLMAAQHGLLSKNRSRPWAEACLLIPQAKIDSSNQAGRRGFTMALSCQIDPDFPRAIPRKNLLPHWEGRICGLGV